NVVHDRGAADCLLIEPRLKAVGGIDDELNLLALDQIHNVGPALFDFVHAVGAEAGILQNIGRSTSRHQFEPEVGKTPANLRNLGFIVISNADKNRAA